LYDVTALEKNCRAISPGLPDGIFSCQKCQIWVIFGGSSNGRCWYIYGYLVNFTAIYMLMVIWYILWSLGSTFFPVLVSCTKKNLATLNLTWSGEQIEEGFGTVVLNLSKREYFFNIYFTQIHTIHNNAY
jgi:hypothetical protein